MEEGKNRSAGKDFHYLLLDRSQPQDSHIFLSYDTRVTSFTLTGGL